MKLEVDVNLYIHSAHDDFSNSLKLILEKVAQMTVDVSNLTTAIADEDTVIDSAVAAINGFPAVVGQAVKDALTAAGVADAAAQTAADAATADVQAKTAQLKAALTANVPNPPTPASL